MHALSRRRAKLSPSGSISVDLSTRFKAQWMASSRRGAAGKSRDKPAGSENKGSAGISPVWNHFLT
jgi:hypothetical protein